MNLALLPLCLEIPNRLKHASLAQSFEDLGYLVFRQFTHLYLQRESSPWRRGVAPTHSEIHTIIQTLQARGLDGQCIRTYPEDYNAIPITQDQHPGVQSVPG